MKKQQTTIVLLILFFAGLIGLKLADIAAIPTAEQLRQTSGLVLPELKDTTQAQIQRLELVQYPAAGSSKESPKERRIVFERRGEGWQIVEPIEAAADPARLEILVQNIKNLRKSPEAGTLSEDASKFGFSPPRATVRAFGSDAKTALATLDVGKAMRDRLYVRPGKDGGIEVVESRIFQGIDQPVVDWRDRSIFNLPTFQVLGFKVSVPGHSVQAERREKRWQLTAPFSAPADDMKIEETLAELTSLKVIDGEKGFVADNARDLSVYGLDKDATKVELFSARGPAQPYVLLLGKTSPDDPNKRYALRADQDDVLLVDNKSLKDLGIDPYKFRGKRVAEFDPSLVDFLEIKAFGKVFTLSHTTGGWVLVKPERTVADADSIPALIMTLNTLQASEFLNSSQVPQPELDNPPTVVRVWQGKRGKDLPKEPITERKDPPTVTLKLGRHDILRKTVYGRVGDEPAILAIPDPFLKVLPQNQFAYRNRQIVTLSPPEVSRITLDRDGREFTLERGLSKDPNRWQMLAPIAAPADNESITKILLILSQLTAERWVADNLDDSKSFGLDDPSVTVSWTTSPNGMPTASAEGSETKTLRIGARVPKQDALYYANLLGSPAVFTIPEGAVLPFHEEFRDRRVLSFAVKQVERVKLSWPKHSLSFSHHPTPRGGPQDWSLEPSGDKDHFDLSRIDSLVSDLSRFRTRKFLQHKGSISTGTGLETPKLVVHVELGKEARPIDLRVGNPFGGGEFFATLDRGNQGTVFLLSGTGWSELLKEPGALPELPDDVFAPEPKH